MIRKFITQFSAAAFLAGLTAVSASAQDIDCADDFELFIPLLEKNLAILERRTSAWGYQPQKHLDYIEHCQFVENPPQVSINLAIARFLTHDADNGEETLNALADFALNGNEDAMLQLMAVFDSSGGPTNVVEYFLAELVNANNENALLFYALKQFEQVPEGEDGWQLLLDTLVRAVENGNGQACYYISEVVLDNVNPHSYEGLLQTLNVATEQGLTQCNIAKYSLCYAVNELPRSNDPFNRQSCETFLGLAVNSGDSYAEFLRNSIGGR